MFQSARFKLTLWYLLIIMAISIFFSAVIYFGATREFDRILRVQRYRMEHPEIRFRIMQQGNFFETIPLPPLREPQLIQEAKMRVLQNLIGINTLILLFSSLAGYFLAGRTLKPIKEMVEEQNRFITDASHELNTPLTSLRTSIEVNLRDSQLTLEKAKEVLESNLEETKNLHILSDELIKLTQYQKPNGNFAFETIVLADVIAAAIQKINK